MLPCKTKPLVYACSGCTRAGRLSHDVAMGLMNDNVANVGCLPALALGFESEKERAARCPVLVLDGCEQKCGLVAFQQLQLNVKWHVDLNQLCPSHDHESVDYSLTELYAVMAHLNRLIAQQAQ
ncbi:putative zinc-binding protein [Aliidiomarina celeris]|uniref:putative zinc-binding protein n=1 Tax=Aliidiomarina celeris TaxID=2249428 RepID=UPI000DEA3F67|nr:putative zinc-binding protein [Aliidiomarina celeris]